MIRKNMPLLLPLALSVVMIYPFLFLAGGSVMGALELSRRLSPVLEEGQGFAFWGLLPRFPTLRPFVELLLDSPRFFVMFWNSVKLEAFTLVGQLLISVPAAWGFARFRFRGSRALFMLYIVLMLMPFQVTMVSSYLVLDGAHLLDTHWSIILPAVFSTFPVFLIHRFFCDIPEALLESAEIDGAGAFRAFLYIGLPLGRAGIASAMVLGFLEYWNLIEQPMTFIKTKSLWPISLFLPEITSGKVGLALAASVVALLPALLVFLYGQTWLEQGIVAASVKE